MADLTHLDGDGNVHMVDVGGKTPTRREAKARSIVILPEVCRRALADGGDTKKGNVFQVARLAAIMATKRTSDLIPLCHPLPITGVDVDIRLADDRCLIDTAVRVDGKTGVEMEALTAATVGALTVYDMLKALSHDIVIERTELLHKSGGRSDSVDRTPNT